MTTQRRNRGAGQPPPLSFLYNPFEIAVCDPLGLFGSDLATALARELAHEFKVGTVKEGTPSSDAPAKDGVTRLLNSEGQSVLAYPRGHYGAPLIQPLIELDFVLIEESIETLRPKIVITGDGPPPVTGDAVAYVAESWACPILPPTEAFFTREDVGGLARHLSKHLRAQAAEVAVYGLVLAGGGGPRMEGDKGALQYHDMPQVRYCYDLLKERCEDVFVSTRKEQPDDEALHDLPLIPDRFLGFGPMGGILSAMTDHPRAAWCVLAFDLPFVDAETLDYLLKGRNPFRLATTFVASNGYPEPLCAVYEPKCVFPLFRSMAEGCHSLHQILDHSGAQTLSPPNPEALTNVSTKEDYEKALARLKAEGRTI